jgi:hypothetical protein
MSRRGRVHLVGVGPGEESWMSLGALRAIRAAEEIWCTDLGSWNAERRFLRKYLHGKKVVNLSGFYALRHVRRGTFYRMTAGASRTWPRTDAGSRTWPAAVLCSGSMTP